MGEAVVKTVLIVDDEFDIAYALGSVFEEEGFEARRAATAASASKSSSEAAPTS